ncbi:hypothetical protein GCK72_014651 [Caenorhabditis remanei]|uniref:Uncharacterized protein n=1 Tax=Caenorhabditis remanei TaxID=31234 RepID=A0A6A5GUP4_CAERE|nr:hypothetical protein GCK72_014651 [Caenorhabditis remanei]KAF1758193.1 hypothetical protein GCK72_014651 [Caenorhabditis remanei]
MMAPEVRRMSTDTSVASGPAHTSGGGDQYKKDAEEDGERNEGQPTGEGDLIASSKDEKEQSAVLNCFWKTEKSGDAKSSLCDTSDDQNGFCNFHPNDISDIRCYPMRLKFHADVVTFTVQKEERATEVQEFITSRHYPEWTLQRNHAINLQDEFNFIFLTSSMTANQAQISGLLYNCYKFAISREITYYTAVFKALQIYVSTKNSLLLMRSSCC